MNPKYCLLSGLLALALPLSVGAAVNGAGPGDPDKALVTSRYTNGIPTPAPLVAGESDANVMRLVSQILQKQHYSKKPFDDELSSKFFDRYLDALDNLHIFFTKQDVEEFEKHRFKLDDLTMNRGDAAPARQIFNRFRERLAQQYDYAMDLLKHEKFEFKGDDRFMLDRKKLPRPSTLADAKQLWRDRLRYEYLQEKLNKEQHDQIVTNLTRRYTRVMRTINEYDNDDVLQIYLTALAHIYDPHSDYMGKSELDNFSIGMKLSLYGIGALLQSEDGICRIKSLTPGGPAEKSKKLKAEDRIIAVAQGTNAFVDVVDMKLNKVVELIRGPKDTEVRLTIIPADAADSSARKIIQLVRDEIKLEDGAAKAKIMEVPDGKDANGKERNIRIGVIDLPSFYSSFELEGRKGGEQKSTTTDVAKLLKKLIKENVTGVVLDLRRNGGGSLEEAINLTGLFIKEGPVVQVRSSNGRIDVDNDPDPSVFYDGPVIVLTSRFSASASEILAGALQDYGRALIVGDSTTHGKGTVQSLLQLAPIMRQNGLIGTNDPGAVKITIRKFYRASGASTQLRGVTPDIVLPSVNNLLETGESSIDHALPWDTIEPARYEQVNRVEPYLVDLKKHSDQRIVSDRDFAFVREEMDRYKKLQADKSVSLNEAVRLKEKKEADDRAKARKKELLARPEPPGKIYDITLKLADEPGLPAPTVRTNNTVSNTLNVTNAIKSFRPGATLTKIKGTNAASGEEIEIPAGEGIAKKLPKSNPHALDPDVDESVEPDAPAVDITLDETRRILIDYIHLLDKAGGVAATKPGKPTGANN
jgi:carboxyl-terminal processing protease